MESSLLKPTKTQKTKMPYKCKFAFECVLKVWKKNIDKLCDSCAKVSVPFDGIRERFNKFASLLFCNKTCINTQSSQSPISNMGNHCSSFLILGGHLCLIEHSVDWSDDTYKTYPH